MAKGPSCEAVDTAAAITSDLPIVVERAMYSTRPGQPAVRGRSRRRRRHRARAALVPRGRRDGRLLRSVSCWSAIPTRPQSDLKVTYLLPNGRAVREDLFAWARSSAARSTCRTKDPRLANTPVSVIVESTNNQPVVVERAMWWPKGQWHEAHVSAGATTTGTRWALADGEVDGRRRHLHPDREHVHDGRNRDRDAARRGRRARDGQSWICSRRAASTCPSARICLPRTDSR